MASNPVLVGIDQSPGTRAALIWAVADAATRRGGVHLVQVCYRDGQLEPSAERILDGATAFVNELNPTVPVTSDVVDGDPVLRLLDAAGHSSVTVLGSRQLKALGSSVLGSVSGRVAARSTRPTVVMRGVMTETGNERDGREVIVGMDDSDGSQAALEFAFDHAHRHRVPLRAVMSWSPPPPAASNWNQVPALPYVPMDVWLGDLVHAWQQKYPEVVVHTVVTGESTTKALVARSEAAQLLVVGSRARRATPATLLGSVSQGVLHHAGCPVAIVPAHRIAEVNR